MAEIHFAKNLRYLRKKASMTQAQMRAIFGIKRASWSNYERGDITPRITELIEFSRYFGVSLDDLVLHDLGERERLSMKAIKKPIRAKHTP